MLIDSQNNTALTYATTSPRMLQCLIDNVKKNRPAELQSFLDQKDGIGNVALGRVAQTHLNENDHLLNGSGRVVVDILLAEGATHTGSSLEYLGAYFAASQYKNFKDKQYKDIVNKELAREYYLQASENYYFQKIWDGGEPSPTDDHLNLLYFVGRFSQVLRHNKKASELYTLRVNATKLLPKNDFRIYEILYNEAYLNLNSPGLVTYDKSMSNHELKMLNRVAKRHPEQFAKFAANDSMEDIQSVFDPDVAKLITNINQSE